MTRMNVRVRPATHDDVPALVCLLQAVDLSAGTFSGRPLTDTTTDHLTERLTTLLDSDRVLLIAADEEGAALGLLAGRTDEVGAVDLTPVLHVTHLLVAPGQRRRGIARSLLSFAVTIADDLELEHVLATAAAGSREGNRYLARLGFAPLVVHRLAPTATLRRTLGMTDPAGRVAVLRRARLMRAQRSGFSSRAVGRGA